MWGQTEETLRTVGESDSDEGPISGTEPEATFSLIDQDNGTFNVGYPQIAGASEQDSYAFPYDITETSSDINSLISDVGWETLHDSSENGDLSSTVPLDSVEFRPPDSSRLMHPGARHFAVGIVVSLFSVAIGIALFKLFFLNQVRGSTFPRNDLREQQLSGQQEQSQEKAQHHQEEQPGNGKDRIGAVDQDGSRSSQSQEKAQHHREEQSGHGKDRTGAVGQDSSRSYQGPQEMEQTSISQDNTVEERNRAMDNLEEILGLLDG